VNVVAIVQARMGSRRLPGKVLADLGGKSLVNFLLMRLGLSHTLDEIIVATTSREDDDVLVAHIKTEFPNIHVFRGSEDNLLERYKGALADRDPDYVVRVTADNPFTDPVCLDEMVSQCQTENLDYICSTDMPIGTAVDVFKFSVLKRVAEEATTPYQNEHINAYFLDNSDMFSLGQYFPSINNQRPDIEVTVDTDMQLSRVRKLVENGVANDSSLEQIVSVCDAYGEL
jgi:spore coat polysaccharide biosynthesis protein SpsF